jgi:hypothetical protein
LDDRPVRRQFFAQPVVPQELRNKIKRHIDISKIKINLPSLFAHAIDAIGAVDARTFCSSSKKKSQRELHQTEFGLKDHAE